MEEQIQKYLSEIEAFTATSAAELESFRIQFLGKKGVMNALFASFKDVAPENRKATGQALNGLTTAVENKLEEQRLQVESASNADGPSDDLTKTPVPSPLGSRHPISTTIDEVIGIFQRIGFVLSEGPEIEDDWHNFTALNLPEDHPARDMQDTFFVNINPDHMLRTHTSSVQVRYMEGHQPPIRIISPGRVFRNEAISARSHCMFHQVEGLYIDRKVSFADMVQTLRHFAREMFGTDAKIRLRPSYFPFTEPSAEMDVYWGLKTEADYRMTKGTGWLEVLGCGMVDPRVLENCGIDPEIYSGFAFGIGIERTAMRQYQIPDIRLFTENDLRFLQNFESVG